LGLALGLQDTEHVLLAGGGEALARRDARDLLVLAEVLHPAALLVVGVARVEHDHGDTGLLGLLDLRAQRAGVGVGDRDAVDLAVDRVLDQLGLLGRVVAVGVLQRDVVLGGRRGRAVPDDVPERVARRGVGDHRDREALGVGVTGRDGRAAIGGGLGGLLAAGRGARGQDER